MQKFDLLLKLSPGSSGSMESESSESAGSGYLSRVKKLDMNR